MTSTVALRDVSLPGGGQLVVRRATPADVDALADLFEGLPADDLYRRFFSVYHPDRAFFEAIAALCPPRGAALVATADGQVVAEADYHVQTSRPDPGLSITVAPRWRGWLGPCLLDALLEVAAADGR